MSFPPAFNRRPQTSNSRSDDKDRYTSLRVSLHFRRQTDNSIAIFKVKRTTTSHFVGERVRVGCEERYIVIALGLQQATRKSFELNEIEALKNEGWNGGSLVDACLSTTVQRTLIKARIATPRAHRLQQPVIAFLPELAPHTGGIDTLPFESSRAARESFRTCC